MVKKVWQTDEQTDRRTEPFIELLGRSLKHEAIAWTKKNAFIYRPDKNYVNLKRGV